MPDMIVFCEGSNDWGWPLPPETWRQRVRRTFVNVGRFFSNSCRAFRRRPRHRYMLPPTEERNMLAIERMAEAWQHSLATLSNPDGIGNGQSSNS